jgi:spermidine synthase
VGTVYVYEALGSLAAGLLHAFYFVTELRVFPMFLLTATGSSVLILAACAGAARAKGRGPRLLWSPSLLLLGAVLIALTGAHRSLEDWTAGNRWRSFAGDLELVESRDSRYQNIALARQPGQFDLYLNGFYAESFPDPYANALFAHFVMSEHPDPESVLVLGSGITGLLHEILLHRPVRLDYVELDGALLSLVSRHLPEETTRTVASPAVRIVPGDGRHFVKLCPRAEPLRRYDMVIVNVPEPSNAMLNRYYTREFYSEVSRILAPGGVIVTGLPFTENYVREEVLAYGKSVFRSLSDVFEAVVISPGNRILFFASDSAGMVTEDASVLASRYEERGITSAHFSRDHFSMLLLPERVAFVRDAFSGRAEVPVNTDMHPVSYYYGLRLWDRFSGGHLAFLLDALGKVKAWMAGAALAVLFLVRAGFHRLTRESRAQLRSFSILFSIFTTGFAGISLSILLMISFQAAAGYLYGYIGLLVALFMLGLAAGGQCTRREARGRGGENLMMLLEAVSLVFPLLLVIVVSFLIEGTGLPPAFSEAAFSVLMFLSGMYAGAEFPLSSALYIEGTGRLGRGAGVIDALDHGGAFLGAFLAGVILLPLAGVAATLVLLSGVKALALSFWVYFRLSEGRSMQS